ncbi:TolC family protein [Olivibacter sp. SDN3]|uniref:TolC family protein n=1 Tax=Olivibacter sp. SDN3 TaxID=2764720 RepID=UPI001650F364|nr:TolC family protein [Olivibacter sp. SDN3]QNL51769.1 TolC family protein [Olivibacter sp. SDN3]
MTREKLFSLILALWLIPAVWAQENENNTELKEFTLNDLEELLMAHHPVVKQALLLSEAAKAQVAQARGNFDPALKATFNNKYFGNTDYYNHWNSELKVPVWLAGADLKVAYDRNIGRYTNPETTTSTAGLSGVGISIPLGQGLIIDNRRSTLKQAQAMLNYAEAEQVKQINSIWFEAVHDYWDWYFAFRQYELLVEGVQLAETRFRAISMQTVLGDAPPIDSVEAAITVQERQIELAKYIVELKNSRLALSNHLWNENQQPVELPDHAIPSDVDTTGLKPDPTILHDLLNLAQDQHPELLKLESKSEQLYIEERFRKELLKPKLNVSGTLISNRRNFNETIPHHYDFNWSNYKLGVDFAFPLFLRTERGKLKEVKLKQEQLQYDQLVIGRNISNDITTKYNDLTAYSDQLELQVLSITNQQVLLNGEQQKFGLGESTLFIINSRESKLIEMKIKRENLIANFNKALAELYYKAGTRLLGE